MKVEDVVILMIFSSPLTLPTPCLVVVGMDDTISYSKCRVLAVQVIALSASVIKPTKNREAEDDFPVITSFSCQAMDRSIRSSIENEASIELKLWHGVKKTRQSV